MVKTVDQLREEIVPHLNFLIDGATRVAKAARMGNACVEISRHCRAFGICLLLTEAEVDAFFHWLIQSATVRRHYLRLAMEQDLQGDRHQRASFADPFFDAVAASQWTLARQIASLSPSEWMEGAEYEEDFCHARFYLLLAAPSSPQPELEATLGRWERALEGGEDARLAVAHALLARDQRAFDGSFAELLAGRKRQLDEIADPARDSILAQDYCFEPNRQLFVEGLALLRFAEERGLQTRVEYPTCPSAARRKLYAPFRPLAFPNEQI